MILREERAVSLWLVYITLTSEPEAMRRIKIEKAVIIFEWSILQCNFGSWNLFE